MNGKLDKAIRIMKIVTLSLFSLFFLSGIVVAVEGYYEYHPEATRNDKVVLRECRKAAKKNIDLDFEKFAPEDFDCVYILDGEFVLKESGIDISGEEDTLGEHICFVKDNCVVKQINLFYCVSEKTADEVRFAFRKDNGIGERFSIDEPKIMKFDRGDAKFKIQYTPPDENCRYETFVLYRD